MITIEEVGPEFSPRVFNLVFKLLNELSEESGNDLKIDPTKVLDDWKASESRFTVFIAFSETVEALGIITIAENFAIYAGGNYGIINELYVEPSARNKQVGKMLIETAKAYAQAKGWRRLDVVAPLGDKWQRTVSFYLREGFVHCGPKLKFIV